ncbi:unnamed protein product [Dracunculus medinensis]|uniref:Uncharacterized protein n=1 Tax=Dracunculus medinensis TaxID=318479 RepID=A0A0N4U7T7_DRAME|nr:unnamed protein product [Dracunculus medinensis]
MLSILAIRDEDEDNANGPNTVNNSNYQNGSRKASNRTISSVSADGNIVQVSTLVELPPSGIQISSSEKLSNSISSQSDEQEMWNANRQIYSSNREKSGVPLVSAMKSDVKPRTKNRVMISPEKFGFHKNRNRHIHSAVQGSKLICSSVRMLV